VASLAWVVRRVWLTYWRVVLSLSAMVVTVRPRVRSAQMSFWLWLRGEDTLHAGGINICKYANIYKYLSFAEFTRRMTANHDIKVHYSN
jgi:hypothetical protein